MDICNSPQTTLPASLWFPVLCFISVMLPLHADANLSSCLDLHEKLMPQAQRPDVDVQIPVPGATTRSAS